MRNILIILGVGFILYQLWNKGNLPIERDVYEEPKDTPGERKGEDEDEDELVYPNPFV